MTDISNMPGHLIRRYQQIAVSVFISEARLAGFDLTPVQFAALSVTQDNPGLDQATLAGMIAYDRTTIGGVVDRLVQKGLMVRDVSDRDRRARVLRISQKGQKVLQAIRPVVEEVQAILLSGLTEKEGDELLRLLRKATNSLNDLSRAPLRASTTDG